MAHHRPQGTLARFSKGFIRSLQVFYTALHRLYKAFESLDGTLTSVSTEKTHFKNSDYVYILCEVSNR